MKDRCNCFWCNKEIEFDFLEDTREMGDENCNGDYNYWYEVFCPHCEKWSRIY